VIYPIHRRPKAGVPAGLGLLNTLY